MGLFNRGPDPTIRTGFRKTDQHLDQVFVELEAAIQAGQASYAVSIGWGQAPRSWTPAQTILLYIDHLQKAGYAIQSAVPPASGSGYATVIVDLSGSVARPAQADGPTVMGVPSPIQMIAAFGNGWVYAVHEDNVWKTRHIYKDDTPEATLREYSSYKELCIAEGREAAATSGSIGIIPTEMQQDFAAAFNASLRR